MSRCCCSRRSVSCLLGYPWPGERGCRSSREKRFSTGIAASSGAAEPMGDPFEGLIDSGDVLERVGVDLTGQARRGDLEPVRCRDAEIARVVDILLRQNKNNPALIGRSGVGKTPIVEGLAQRIAPGAVPPPLQDAPLLPLHPAPPPPPPAS